MKALKTKKQNKMKLTLKEKVAVAAFMEAFPRLKQMWEESDSYSTTTFDQWLQDVYNSYQNLKKGETN